MSSPLPPYDLSRETDRRAVVASALGSQRASGTGPDPASLAELDAFVRAGPLPGRKPPVGFSDAHPIFSPVKRCVFSSPL